MKTCSIPECSKPVFCKGFCNPHYQKNRLYGTPSGRPVHPTGYIDDFGYKMLSINGRKVREHVHIVESVLGKKLPKGPVVHHWNEIKADNRKENLLVCHDEAYHQMIHRRMRAYYACGDASARQCIFCKQWSSVGKITVNPANSSSYHNACRSAMRRAQYANRSN